MSEAKDETPQPEKKSRKKLVLVAVLAVVLLAGAGGAAWHFLLSGPEDGSAAHADAKKRGNPVFASLEPFTVNLADPDGDRVAQVGVVLELNDSKASATITMLMPAVRNGILLLLSGKQSSELLTVEGKERLAREIATVTGSHLGWSPAPAETSPKPESAEAKDTKSQPASKSIRAPNPVAAVHFSQFLVQ